MVKCAGCSRESSHSPGKVANMDPGDGGMEKLRRTTHDAHRVAGTTPLGLEGYLCHAASLDADCWQDPLGSDAVAQSFLARGALCDVTRTDHLANPLRDRTFELEFDFLDHKLRASASDGGQKEIGLFPRSVADFYAEIMRSLAALGIEVRINELPNEIPDAIRFSEDHVHASYDREYAERHWRVLLQVNRVLHAFRTSFIGKCSPVHFFWGSFDLAVTRFSGCRAHPMPAGGGIPNLPEAVMLDAEFGPRQ